MGKTTTHTTLPRSNGQPTAHSRTDYINHTNARHSENSHINTLHDACDNHNDQVHGGDNDTNNSSPRSYGRLTTAHSRTDHIHHVQHNVNTSVCICHLHTPGSEVCFKCRHSSPSPHRWKTSPRSSRCKCHRVVCMYVIFTASADKYHRVYRSTASRWIDEDLTAYSSSKMSTFCCEECHRFLCMYAIFTASADECHRVLRSIASRRIDEDLTAYNRSKMSPLCSSRKWSYQLPLDRARCVSLITRCNLIAGSLDG